MPTWASPAVRGSEHHEPRSLGTDTRERNTFRRLVLPLAGDAGGCVSPRRCVPVTDADPSLNRKRASNCGVRVGGRGASFVTPRGVAFGPRSMGAPSRRHKMDAI